MNTTKAHTRYPVLLASPTVARIVGDEHLRELIGALTEAAAASPGEFRHTLVFGPLRIVAQFHDGPRRIMMFALEQETAWLDLDPATAIAHGAVSMRLVNTTN